MKSFKEVFLEAISIKEGKICFIIDVLGVIAALCLAAFFKGSTGWLTGLMMGVSLMVVFASERFGAIIRLIREKDLESQNKKMYKNSKKHK